MTFRHSNELLLRIKANIVHDLMLHYGMLIYLKPCRNFEKVDNVQTKYNETKIVVVDQFWHFIAAYELYVLFFSSVFSLPMSSMCFSSHLCLAHVLYLMLLPCACVGSLIS